MRSTSEIPGVRFSRQLYERLLAFYPQAHREEYGPAMAQLFGDQCRDAWRAARGWGLAGLWLRVLPDLVKTSVLEHLATLNERKSMFERMAAMLRPRSAPSSVFLGVFVVVFLLVVTTSIIVTFILPETYASTARIKVERDFPNNAVAGPQLAMLGYDPYFIQTEFEVIQSAAVLNQVVTNLDLCSEWGTKYAGGVRLKVPEALVILKSRTDLRPVRNTSLIEIREFSDNPEEAARVANAIVESYKQYRRDQWQQLTLNAIKLLEDRFQDQEKKVQQAQQDLEALRKKLVISSSDAAGTQAGPTIEAESLRRLKGLQIEAQAQLAKDSKVLEKLKEAPVQDLKNVLPGVVQDSNLSDYLQQLNLAEQERIRLRKDLSDDNPAVVTVTKQIADLERKIADRCQGILTGLETRVASSKGYVDSIDAEIEKAREADLAKSEASRPYYEAKQRLEEIVRFRTILNMKLASEKIDADIPKTVTVEIVDRATPGFRPVRPNKPLNIVWGAFCGAILALLFGGGAAFVTSWLGKRAPGHVATT